MNKYLCFILFLSLILPDFLSAQNSGINFQQGLSWKELQAKARAENKYIFIDCYATWCGPCKYMDREIYPQNAVGEYFNAHFICVKLQMDRTPGDSSMIRDRYADARFISAQYAVNAYPTYLFFSPDEVFLYKQTGSTENGQAFIDLARDALNPSKQYPTLINHWRDHINDSAYLRLALISSLNIRDKRNLIEIGESYIKSLKDPLTKENIPLFCQLLAFNNSMNSELVQLFIRHASPIDARMDDPWFVERLLTNMIFRKEITPLLARGETPINWKNISSQLISTYPTLNGEELVSLSTSLFRDAIISEINTRIKNTDTLVNWDKLSAELNIRFPEYDDLDFIILDQEANYFADKGLWKECEHAAVLLLDHYCDRLDLYHLNNIAWDYFFSHFNDRNVLIKAVKCMKRSMDKTAANDIECNDLDTYANLLYKTGKRKEAMDWENKAIEMGMMQKTNPGNLTEFRNNLEKMNKKQPTWDQGS